MNCPISPDRPARRQPWAPATLLAVLAVALTGLTPARAAAQTCPLAPGCTQSVQETLPFATSNQSLWGPGGDESLLSDISISLFDTSWDASDSSSDIPSFTVFGSTWKFGGSVSGTAKGRIATFFDLDRVGTATVDVTYPVAVSVTVPEPNTFRPGDPIVIQTAWAPVAEDASFSTELWTTDMTLRGIFGFENSAKYKICLVSCTAETDFFPPMKVPEQEFPIIRSGGGSFGIGDQEPKDVGSFLDFLATFATGVVAYVNEPDPLGSPSLSGTTLEASGSDEWARFDVDLDTFLRFLAALGGASVPVPPLGVCLELADSYDAFDLCYETVDMDSRVRVIQDEDVSFDASVQARMTFPTEVAYDVLDASGAVTASGVAATVTWPVGHALRVYTPASTTPMDLTPTFSLHNTVSRTSDLRLRSWLKFESLKLQFDMAQVSHSGSKYHPEERRWVSCSEIIEADSAGEFFSRLGDCIAGTISGVWKTIRDAWTETITKTVNAIDIDLGPVAKQNLEEREVTIPLLDRSWELDGFTEMAGAPFTLDPEDPRIAVSTSVANALLATGANAGQVIQTIDVTNDGDVPLTLQEIADGLSAPGLTVEALSASGVIANPAFDGLGDLQAMASGMLDVGGSASLTVRMTAEPGYLHTLDVNAAGLSPIGTHVSADASASFATFQMVMKPFKVEYKKGKAKGRMKARVCSSETLDVRDLDTSSLRLEGVAPDKVKFKEDDDDDDDDEEEKAGKCPGDHLELTFQRAAIIEALLARTAAQATMVAQRAARPDAVLDLNRTVTEVAQALLAGAGLTPEEARTLDALGNANGRADLGDLRAYAFQDPVFSTAMAKKAKSAKKSKKSEKSSKSAKSEKDDQKAPTHILVLTGTMGGTPLWAEAPIHLKLKQEND